MTAAAETQEIERFTDALWMEHGLSKNTLAAYRNDLAGLATWLDGQGRQLRGARRQDLLAYLSERVAACLLYTSDAADDNRLV